MKTTRLSEDKCLACSKVLDAASSNYNEGPREGDYTICINCGHVMVFDANLKLRPPNDAEILDIAADPEILRYQKAREIAKKLEI